jgi:hypothetical protein
VGASSRRGESLSFSLVAVPAEAKSAVKSCGATAAGGRRPLTAGPSGGYPAKKKPGVLVGLIAVVWGRLPPPVLTR